MSSSTVESIASAILYEGYILYPYRPALKNRQRWTFGGLYPRAYSEAHCGSDAWSMQTECLVLGNSQTHINVKVRCLQLVARTAGELLSPTAAWQEGVEPEYRPVELLRVGDRQYATWQEAVERVVSFEQPLPLAHSQAGCRRLPFAFREKRTLEPVGAADGTVVGVLLREQQAIEGLVELDVSEVSSGVYRVTVRVLNETSLEDAERQSRDNALLRSLVSTHVLLTVGDGQFISQIDPDEPYRELAAECRNVGAWPVLVGEAGSRDAMLAAPIILYDYPQVAPESPGDLFDGTEIDELLTLRIMTLTDEEKQAMAAVDQRADQLLARTEALARDELLRLHGTIRHLRPFDKEKRDG